MQRLVGRARRRGRSGRARRAVLSPKPERKGGREAAVLGSAQRRAEEWGRRGCTPPRGYLLNRPPAFTFRPPFPRLLGRGSRRRRLSPSPPGRRAPGESEV